MAALDLTDPGWVPDYVAQVTPLVERMCGRYLARTTDVVALEGRPAPAFLVLVEWPSRAAAEAFYGSAAYRPFGDSRRAGARTDLLLAAGEDVTGLATIEGASE